VKPLAAIQITNLRTRALIGTRKEERARRQEIFLNIRISYNAKKAVLSDSLPHALDYDRVAQKVLRLTRTSRFHLLETLGAALMNAIMEDKKIIEAWIRIDKPGALRYAGSVSVEMIKKRRQISVRP